MLVHASLLHRILCDELHEDLGASLPGLLLNISEHEVLN